MVVTLLLIGLAAGVLGGAFGIGGGVLVVPALVFLAHMPIKQATGTSLGALLLPVGLLGALVYWRDGHLNIRAAMLVAIGLIIGAYIGAVLVQDVKPALLTRLFSLFLATMAVRLWMSV